jgi:hypothetical protein
VLSKRSEKQRKKPEQRTELFNIKWFTRLSSNRVFFMKWILKVTKITSYVAQCANAIAKAAQTLSDNWPVDNPFKSTVSPVVNAEKEGVALGN